ELLLVSEQRDRRHMHGYLGRRGAAERDHGGKPALALGGDSGHGAVHGRNLLSQGSGAGLRRRRHLRILLLWTAADHHRRHRLADQSAGDQGAGTVMPREGGASSNPCTCAKIGDYWIIRLHGRWQRLVGDVAMAARSS